MLAVAPQALADEGGRGTVKICKKAVRNSGLRGTFSFQVHDSVGDRTVAVGVAGCSSPFTATGPITITEIASSGTQVTKIRVRPARRQVSQDVSHGTVVVTTTHERAVVVTFTNGPASPPPPPPQSGFIEVCKTLPDDAGITFRPTFTFTIDGGAPFNLSAVGGQTVCSSAMTVSVGDHTVAETGIPAGFELLGVAVSPSQALVGGARNPVTVSVFAPPASDPGARTRVTFANHIKRAPVRVCKSAAADSPWLLGQTFNFTASGVGLPASFRLTPSNANANLDCQVGTPVPVLQNDGSATTGTIAETNSGVTADITVTGGGSGNVSGRAVAVTLNTTGNDVGVSFVDHGRFQCPSTDALGFALGVSNTTEDPIFCSYPAVAGQDPNLFFCTYSAVTGQLVQDHNAGLCRPNAVAGPASVRRSATMSG